MFQESKNKEDSPVDKKRISTKIIDDVFTDEVSFIKPRFEINYDAYLHRLWDANLEIHDLLKNSPNIEASRDSFYSYLEKAERSIFTLENDLHLLEKATVRECVKVLRSIIAPINESRSKFSALDCLWKLAHDKREELTSEVSVGFLMEFINLFRGGVKGKSNIYIENSEVKKGIPAFLQMKGREAATARMKSLDDLGSTVRKYFKKYPSGLEEEIISWRDENREKILSYFNASESDWNDYAWQLKHVIRTSKPILDLIELSSEQRESIEKAVKNHIPFGITPYYLSLMDSNLSIGYDHAIRYYY